MKKIISVFLIACIYILTFSFSAFAYENDGGYGDSNANVNDDLDNGYCLSSSVLKISGNYVKGISSGMLCCLANRQFNDPECVNFYSSENNKNLLKFDNTIKTGDCAVFIDGNAKSDSKIVAISGDITGDSKTNVTDIVDEINCILNNTQSSLTKLAFACADINDDSKITVTDVIRTRSEISNANEAFKSINYDTTEYSVSDYYNYFKTQGRCYNLGDKIAIDFTGCVIDFNAVCEGDVYINLSADNGKRFRAVVDGVESDLITVSNTDASGIFRIKVASGLARGVHSVALYKSSEISNAQISSVTLNGVICQKPFTKSGLIEIIGDSITCGAGNVIAVTNNDGSKFTDYTGECTRVMLAFKNKTTSEVSRYDIDYYKTVGSNYFIDVSATEQYTFSPDDYTATQEFYNKDGELITSVPYKNNQVTYSQDGTQAYSVLTAQNLGYDWNVFSRSGATLVEMYDRYTYWYNRDTKKHYQPDRKSDVVVINLSTNGIGNMTEYKEYMGKFVTLLRSYNKDSKIIFAYGAMTQYTFTSLYDTITSTVAELGGSSAGIYEFKFTQSRDGNDGHPSIANHQIMAAELAEYIKTIS